MWLCLRPIFSPSLDNSKKKVSESVDIFFLSSEFIYASGLVYMWWMGLYVILFVCQIRIQINDETDKKNNNKRIYNYKISWTETETGSETRKHSKKKNNLIHMK